MIQPIISAATSSVSGLTKLENGSIVLMAIGAMFTFVSRSKRIGRHSDPGRAKYNRYMRTVSPIIFFAGVIGIFIYFSLTAH